ncbi:microtubule-associated proteins 1A/1B light chain 3A-like [Corticium candelabrum]|uniref:microtubule-associated proteins 1A/1B light chain 3A-like n=1 Tax=Corticium candelabrum TaxID=121492 RepID=UPI002E25333A|nr:microtubule-associated proteins 1A/1B light chain 3A-like [Corticium candelabrum]
MPPSKSFKERRTFVARKQDVEEIRRKFPSKVPVIVERYCNEKYLPSLDKTKFLVPEDITISQFISILRKRLVLRPSQAFYLLVDQKNIASASTSLHDIYRDSKDEDGFLYMVYASQEMFGGRYAYYVS